MADPALTRAQKEVVEAIADGKNYRWIAEWLGICEITVRRHAMDVAAKLPNPDDLQPSLLVYLWAAHRRWLTTHEQNTKDPAA